MAVAQPSLDTIRAVNRLAAPCILDAAMVGRLDRDFVDALILLAIVQANVAPLARDRALQRTYASYEEPPPDSLRRPVSINAIAHSLRLPYETTRRRVLRLVKSGACEVTDHGIIVPTRELSSPKHMAALLAIWEQIRRLYARLRDLDLLDEVVSPEDRARWEIEAGEPPVRAAIRIGSDFMLRMIDNMTAQFGSLIAAVIWFAVLTANTESPADDRSGLPSGSAPDLAADERRRPARVAEVAERLSAPPETVRRYAAELIAHGLCERTPRGLIVSAAALSGPDAVRAMRDNFTDLQRMFAGLAQLGVLAEWDRQFPHLQVVA